jgi:hypothetical protein
MSSSDSPLTAVHPALLLLGLGQPAAPEDPAESTAPQPAISPAQPAFLLLGLQQTASPITAHPTSASEDPA